MTVGNGNGTSANRIPSDPLTPGFTLETGDASRLAEALHAAESIAMSALARLDDEATGSDDPVDRPLNETMVELLHALFDAYDAVEKADIKPIHPEWRDVRDQDQSQS